MLTGRDEEDIIKFAGFMVSREFVDELTIVCPAGFLGEGSWERLILGERVVGRLSETICLWICGKSRGDLYNGRLSSLTAKPVFLLGKCDVNFFGRRKEREAR